MARCFLRLSRQPALALSRLALCLLVFCASIPAAHAQADDQGRIDAWNATLERIDQAARRIEIPDADLRDLARQVADVSSSATAFVADLAPQITAANARVKALSPPKGSDETLSDAAKQELASAQQAYGDLVGLQRQASALVTRGSATQSLINERRRSIFTARLFDRRQSLLDPNLWLDAGKGVPTLTKSVGGLADEWSASFNTGTDRWAAIAIVIALGVMLVTLLGGRSLAAGRLRRARQEQSYSSRSKAAAAALTLAFNTILPALVMLAGHVTLHAFHLSPERVSQIWFGIATSIVLFALAFGVARALLSPSRPGLRLVSLDDALAQRIFRLVVAIALLQAVVIFVERLTRTIVTPLPLTVTIDGILSAATAVLILMTVRSLNRRGGESEEDRDDPSVPLLQRSALVIAGVAAAVALVAIVVGYIALARFVTTQIAWTTLVFSLLFLLTRLTDELTAIWFGREGVVGSRLVASVGFAPRSLTQLGVVLNGIIRVVLTGLALLAVFAPWGFDSNTVLGSFRQLFAGFTIGAITISPITILAAIAVFAIGLIASRAFQRWLETRFLPTTRLDSGLRNSIGTIVGHLGWILAGVIAFSYAGLDLSSIAIVAGALSVGVGLGLQGIVNNFVSGLVLLAERPIRAGDWIVVGTDEGIVKRINIRATEIETFDRATVIVPNSSLITGTVKNMVLHDKTGRAIVKVTVSKTSDPERVRAILLSIAKSHPFVLSFPEPLVLFTDFSATALQFELICFATETGKAGIVRSDVRFSCFREFAKYGISLPMAFPGDIASPAQIGEHSPQPNP